MVKVRMSLLTMSLLAITLASAIAHAAGLDPSLNPASGTGGEFIPYLECIAKCDECTICTKVLPMWKNVCICVNHTKSAISKKPALQSSGKLNKKIPYYLCQRICAGGCVCDRRVPQFAECTCHKPAAALLHTSEILQVKDKSEDSVPKKAAGAEKMRELPESISVPIYECEEKCLKCTACTLMAPWWINTCVCIPKKPADEKVLLLKGKSEVHSSLIPYAECAEKCKFACACAAIWPPPEYCWCSDPIKSSISKKPALQNSGGDDKQIVLWTKAKMETLLYKECIATCEQCACTLIYPPELAICICLTPKPQAAGGKALPM